MLRVSFLHLAPVTGDIQRNRRLLESAVKVAAKEGAGWAITPELWVSGYLFVKQTAPIGFSPSPTIGCEASAGWSESWA